MTTATTKTVKAESELDQTPPVRKDDDVRGWPKMILRAEAAIVLVAALIIYRQLSSGWLLFAILFLTPDLAMLGYLRNRRTGAALYNIGHTYVLPAALGGYGYISGDSLSISLALIWIAHIGFDRLLGYGLKYGTAFQHTHLGRVGTTQAP